VIFTIIGWLSKAQNKNNYATLNSQSPIIEAKFAIKSPRLTPHSTINPSKLYTLSSDQTIQYTRLSKSRLHSYTETSSV
jgi:hypothetical protein